MYDCGIHFLIFDSNNIIYLCFLIFLLGKKVPNFSELFFLSHSEENKICTFNPSLDFILFTWVSIAKIFKRTTGIGLPRRKREARKMGVCPLTQCTISSLLLSPKHLPIGEVLKRLCYTSPETLQVLSYDPLFLFVLLCP